MAGPRQWLPARGLLLPHESCDPVVLEVWSIAIRGGASSWNWQEQ
jgi:hypothetical protein